MALRSDDPTKSRTTTDHREIRKWAEARGGHPARVKESADHPPKGRTGGILRIDFGEPEESLERISWEEFFETFDGNHLAFLYQEEAKHGGTSRFFKFVRGDDAPKRDEEGGDTHDVAGGDDEGDEDDDDDEEGDDEDETELDEEGRDIIEDVDAEVDNEDGRSGRKEANHEASGDDLP